MVMMEELHKNLVCLGLPYILSALKLNFYACGILHIHVMIGLVFTCNVEKHLFSNLVY